MCVTDTSKGCITVSAPGKVLVAGGYLVLDKPSVGVVLAATARFFASVKWTDESAPPMPSIPVEEASILLQRLCIKVESPQFRSVYWYECIFFKDGRLPILLASAEQASNAFVECTLTYVLGYLQRAQAVESADTGTEESPLLSGCEAGRVLAIKLRADNDFYSQTSQLRARGLPCTSKALATLPPFLECPLSEDGTVLVAKTGMGSSAALISSLVGSLLVFFGAARLACLDSAADQESTEARLCGYGAGPGLNESLDLTHNLAQACHCVAQGKVGSGFDVSAAIYGTHTYIRFSPRKLASALSAGDAPSPAPRIPESFKNATEVPTPLERIFTCVGARGGWDAERGQLRLPSCFRLLMGDVCGGSSTPSMVRKVQAWRADPSTADGAKHIWSALGSTNTSIAEMFNALASTESEHTLQSNSFEAGVKALSALPSSKWADRMESKALGSDALEQLIQLKKLFAKARQLLREMGENAGVPIEPPVQTKLVNATSALPGVLCAGVPGAGGVDAVFAIVVHSDAEEGVRDLWASWVTGGADAGSGNEGAVVCPLLLTASEGGFQGGILCTQKLPWE